MMATILRDRRGMTLLEVLVAVGVLVVGLVGVIAVAPMATGAVGEANLKTTATFLAQQRVEEMKNRRWTELVDALQGKGLNGMVAGPEWPDEGYTSIVVGTANYPRFRRVTRITDCELADCATLAAHSSRSTLRQISVTVFFAPHIGTGQIGTNEEFVNITTLVARRP
jgi:prepilin-type N-terminal cleavage/methylation domain-containing protein